MFKKLLMTAAAMITLYTGITFGQSIKECKSMLSDYFFVSKGFDVEQIENWNTYKINILGFDSYALVSDWQVIGRDTVRAGYFSIPSVWPFVLKTQLAAVQINKKLYEKSETMDGYKEHVYEPDSLETISINSTVFKNSRLNNTHKTVFCGCGDNLPTCYDGLDIISESCHSEENDLTLSILTNGSISTIDAKIEDYGVSADISDLLKYVSGAIVKGVELYYSPNASYPDSAKLILSTFFIPDAHIYKIENGTNSQGTKGDSLSNGSNSDQKTQSQD